MAQPLDYRPYCRRHPRGSGVGIYFYQNYDLQGLMGRAPRVQATARHRHFEPELSCFPHWHHPLSISQSGGQPGTADKRGGDALQRRKRWASLQPPVHKPGGPAGGGRILTYDRGGYGYRIDSGSGLHLNSRMENTILTGTISEKRSYAIVTKEARYAGSVTVYSKGNEETVVLGVGTDRRRGHLPRRPVSGGGLRGL